MEPIYIILLVIVGLAIFLGIINSANAVLLDLFKKHSQDVPISQANTVGFLYYVRQRLNIDIDIKRIKGRLTDCYIPKYKTIALSDSTFNQSSIAALAVTAHELGHAIQHQEKPAFFNFIRFLSGVSKFFGSLVIPAIVTAIIMILLEINVSVAFIILYITLSIIGCTFLYKLLTIPLEYNASKIGLDILKDHNILNAEELQIAQKITNAAAFTYVAEFIKDITGLNLLRQRR